MLPNGLDLLHRPDLPAIIARWQHDVTAAELQTGYEALRDLADRAPCHRWLLDIRRRADLTEPAINAWFGEVFAPSLRGRYAAAARLAFLVSPLRAHEPVMAIVSPHNTDCAIATFTNEAAAYQWLQA
ncbi:hypothetical protein HHL22_11720 [Hymenobacter sp. RP-2-7]|uniref:STAS/SEC14 domain-containing protein n=1 Tax=Hymenobacter polaris TaxID=2682546 RepID=A0A7Y0AEH3_9BACT|nr:hypothetical protein [Hymenobacter polaris]NML65873.1 hypothetical protein [Hymenobacter polaris]